MKFSTGHELEGYLKDYPVEKKRVRYSKNLHLPDAPPPTVIPLPAAVWSGITLLGGLGGLGLLRKVVRHVLAGNC